MRQHQARPTRFGLVDPRLRAAWIAAGVPGFGILLVFFVWHWFTIAPVWAVLLEGALGVALAALATAWAWRLSRGAGRFGGRWGGLTFGAVFAGGILLGELIGLARGPRPDPTTAAAIARALPPVLVPLGAVILAGARLVGGWKGGLAYGLAGLVPLVYLGGSIVQRGGVGLGLGLFLILFPGLLASGALLSWLEARSLARAVPAPARDG